MGTLKIYNVIHLHLHAQYWFKYLNNTINYKSKSHQMYGNSYEIGKNIFNFIHKEINCTNV